MSSLKAVASAFAIDVELNDMSLVERCVAGEPVAWKALHRRYFPIVQTFLRRLGTGRDELDDLTQDVFLRTFQFLRSYRGEADLRTWIYRLCLTAASRRHRKRRVHEALLFWLHRDKSPQDVAELASTPELERRMFERALGRLGAGERAVFVLYEMEGVSGKEIAEIVGCPEATVWRRLHYARQNFRRELESMGAFG